MADVFHRSGALIKVNKKVILFVCGLIFILALAKIFLSAKFSTIGAQLAQIEDQKKQLVEDNRFLEEEIIKNSSLREISFRARSFGLSKPTKTVNLTLEMPVALR